MTTNSRMADTSLQLFLVLYLILSAAITFTKAPLNDEGWFAAPGYNLYANGSMGTPALDPNGSWLYRDLPGIRYHTYWIMPLYPVVLSVWFGVAGFSVFAMRALSVGWGILAILSWYTIIHRLTRNRDVAALAAALLCVDYTFVFSAADGRVDMMCLALGSAALGAYLLLRERGLSVALFAGVALVTASFFSHPNGVVYGGCLAVLVGILDIRRLRPIHVLCIVPFVAGALGWWHYIQEDVPDFLAQFSANADARPGVSRVAALREPLRAFYTELLARYAGHYWVAPTWAERVTPWNLLIPVVYWFAVAVGCFRSQIRRQRGVRPLLALSALTFVFFVTNGLKFHFYLCFMVPFYTAFLAMWIQSAPKIGVPHAVTVVVLALQIGSSVVLASRDPYHRTFVPAMNYLKSHTSPSAVVMGSSTLAFEYDYRQLVDDARLAYGNGIRPDAIVVDRYYPMFWDHFRVEQADVHRSLRLFLCSQYHHAKTFGRYEVYFAGGAEGDFGRGCPVLDAVHWSER